MPDGPLRVLVVDDDPAIGRLLAAVVAARGDMVLSAQVTTRAEALACGGAADIVLLDHQLPDGSGLDLLETLRSQPSPPSVIVVTAHGSESVAAAALRRGAEDYLAKDGSLAELLPQVLERVRRHRALRAALAAAERDLVRAERLAAIGEMTVTLHHELNNPLMAASTEVELLLRGEDGPLTPGQRESLEAVSQALARITEIVRRSRELQRAERTDYLDGMGMIALEGPAVIEPPPLGTALVFLPDEDLNRVVMLLLRHTGFSPRRVDSLDRLCADVRGVGVTLVLLPDAVPGSSAPLGGFQPAADREYAVVALATGDPDAARAAGADLAITLPFDPGTFSDELLAVIKR